MASPSRVCVAVPIYNGGCVLINTLECLARQTHENLIVHLFDNGSADETPQVLEKFLQDKDPQKFRLTRSEKPTGMVNDWNVALQSCQGDYLKILPADDLLSPECIGKQAAILDNHPEVGFVVSQKWVINQREEIKGYRFKLPAGVFRKESVFNKLISSPINFLGETGAGMMRLSTSSQIGLFDNQFKDYGDLDYWLRALRVSHGYFLDGRDYFFRVHYSSGTARARNSTPTDFMRLVEKHGKVNGEKFHPLEKRVLYAKAKLAAEIRHFYLGMVCK